MRKYNSLTKGVISALFVAFLASCEPDNDTTGKAYSKPTVSLDQTQFEFTEGESATITITVDQATNRNMNFKLELVGGTGSFRDYETSGNETIIDDGYGVIGHSITVPAYATSYTFDLSSVLDLDTEGTETFEFRFYSAGNGVGAVAEGSEYLNMVVHDVTGDDFAVQLNWAREAPDHFGTIVFPEYLGTDSNTHPYSDWDFDIYVFDSGFNEVSGYQAATGNYPERAIMSGLADGDYYIFADLYSGGTDPVEPFAFTNMYMSFSKLGTWSYNVPIDYYTTATPESAPNGFNGGEYLVAIVTKTGSNYELKDPNTSDVLISGRMSDFKKNFTKVKRIKK